MPTKPVLVRRDFLQVGAATVAAATAGRPAFAAADTVVVAVMGVNKRGSDLIADIVKVPGIEVGTIVDVDEKAARAGRPAAAAATVAAPTWRNSRRASGGVVG
ncbi:MAG: hypothetical protein ACKONH_12055, partial [Planctomycetia bacterium]